MSAASSGSPVVVLPRIEERIQVIRGHKVLIDADLATLYCDFPLCHRTK